MPTNPRIVPHTALHPFAGGEVELLGAVRAVTGAMTMVRMGDRKILVDCGIAQGEEARRWRMHDGAHEADAVVLTHGHNDHVGSLPTLLDRGWKGPIYGTRATLELASIVLQDGLRLQRSAPREIDAFSRRFSELWRPVQYKKGEALVRGSGGLQFRLHDAGHILGSSSVELFTDKNRVIVSGDLGRQETPILNNPNTDWPAGPPVDVAVVETTYGDREHNQGHDDIEGTLERIIKRALADGGHILVPAFAIGRTQVLIYHLNTLIEAGRIPDIPVAVDTPMGMKVTELYQGAKHLFDREALTKLTNGDDPLDFESLYAVRNHSHSAHLRDVKQPMLIIAGSGMCTGGRIVGHLQELLPRPETCVIFIGYQAFGTPGRKIQQAKSGETVRLDGEDVRVNAAIETISGLSAHADRQELWAWLGALPEVQSVALHHGEVDAQEAFARWVQAGAGLTP